MRRKISAGVLLTVALLIPAAPAAAQAATPGLGAACQTIERKLFTDIRELVTIDLDTATDEEIQVVATRILSAAKADSLPVLPGAMQEHLKGTADELRAFLKKGMRTAWTADLRISVARTMTDAGPNVQAAAQKTLDDGSIDAVLTYLNEGLYAARKLDCASQPSPSPSVTPSSTPSASPSVTTPSATPSSSPAAPGGEGDDDDAELAVTGANTGTVAGIGGALLLLGGAGYLIGRRRRSRFVA